jgi:hypothetical protein
MMPTIILRDTATCTEVEVMSAAKASSVGFVPQHDMDALELVQPIADLR